MTDDLFAAAGQADAAGREPLAERMRPRRLDEVIGQDHLLAPGKLLQEMVRAKNLRSLILWGPPGCGKTTIARLLAEAAGMDMIALSAVMSGIREVRAAIAEAEQAWNQNRRRSVLFIDEIHRFNKAQQDGLLPQVENGTVVLIGATTENPSFEVIAPLLSRSRVAVLQPLGAEALGALLDQACADAERGLGGIKIQAEARQALVEASDADARRMLGSLELAADLAADAGGEIGPAHVEQALQSKWLAHDRAGDAHYNLTSALIKCLRDSDVDASLYWCMRMLEAGDDPMYIARRLVVLAAEDVGMADPQALVVANAARDSVHFVGMPEARIPLAMACTYLARAPKSNSAYAAMNAALEDVRQYGALPVPLVLRNAPTGLMKNLGYGAEYAYAHSDPDAASAQQHRPSEIGDRRYYQSSGNGFEGQLDAASGRSEESL